MPTVGKSRLSIIHKLVLEARLGLSLLRLYSPHVLDFPPNTCVEYKRNKDIPSLSSKTSLCIIDSLGFLTMGIM